MVSLDSPTALGGKFPAFTLWAVLLFLQHRGVGFLLVLVWVRRKNHSFPSTALHIIREGKKFILCCIFSQDLWEQEYRQENGKTGVLSQKSSNSYSQPLWASSSFSLGDVALFFFVLNSSTVVMTGKKIVSLPQCWHIGARCMLPTYCLLWCKVEVSLILLPF